MIPFEIPAKFFASVATGNVKRYGAILQDVATGRIVGHMKEVGGLVTGLNPASILSQLGQHAQLAQIQQTLNTLQLISTVGAVASVASLGVSAVGFVVVTRKLNRIEGKLDELAVQVTSIRKTLEHLDLKWDVMTEARLQQAADNLTQALAADTEQRRQRLLEDSVHVMGELRRYYSSLFLALEPWTKHDVPVETAVELYCRSVACALGQLEAEFLLGDMGAFRHSWTQVMDDVRRYSEFDPKLIYRTRSDAATKAGVTEHLVTITEDLPKALLAAKATTNETVARIDSFEAEARWVEHAGLTPVDYARQLRQKDQPDLKLVLWSDELRDAA